MGMVREMVLLLQLIALAYLTAGAGCRVYIVVISYICIYLVVMSKKLFAMEIYIYIYIYMVKLPPIKYQRKACSKRRNDRLCVRSAHYTDYDI